MSFNLGFIGGGNMSTAISIGILKRDAHPVANTWVSGPHLQNLKHWSDVGINTTTKNGEVFCNCDIIFLGVKPAMLAEAVDNCIKTITNKDALKKKKIIVSMLAGIDIQAVSMAFRMVTDNFSVIRIMPNTPMTVGAGACLYTPDQTVTNEECEVVERLLNCCGITERIPEKLVDSLGSLTTCGPAFIYIVIEALADGAVKQGVPRAIALRLASQMVSGSGKMVLESGKHPGQLKDEVCSPGGSTICGVTALENGNLRATLINAIEAAALKTKTFAK